MTLRFVLGWSALAAHPSVLAKASASVEFSIYDTTLATVRSFGLRGFPRPMLRAAVEKAIDEGALTIRKWPGPPPRRGLSAGEIKLSPEEFIIKYDVAQIGAYYVSDDEAFIAQGRGSYAEQAGIRCIHFANLLKTMEPYPVISAEIAKLTRKYQLIRAALRAVPVLGIVLSASAFWIPSIIKFILATQPLAIVAPGLVIVGAGFYWIRYYHVFYYAIAEFFAGIGTGVNAYFISSPHDIESQMLQLLGAIYIVVRSLDNFDKGVEGTRVELFWRRYFKKIEAR